MGRNTSILLEAVAREINRQELEEAKRLNLLGVAIQEEDIRPNPGDVGVPAKKKRVARKSRSPTGGSPTGDKNKHKLPGVDEGT